MSLTVIGNLPGMLLGDVGKDFRGHRVLMVQVLVL